ncbi:UDP-4-amino-4,6-dideoxy-N-acetyl-beta-L-altrosamine N-acetyltransferase [Salicola sp. Rm-C-2C1-2]|uniref:UDP-4-amino-4, 6-dideoxy-N-acetyl-beta-L-altrosamine N-acetyltransferase n=1 Tax=Salicola sp. Rm-C-2C1-2 TaxID=3141321 RepID=UPI0032E4503B
MQLTPITEIERDLILEWRNHPETRTSMFSQRVISQKEHEQWFEHLQDDQSSHWFIAKETDQTPMGVVYFTDINEYHETSFWGFYTKPTASAGTGTRMLFSALDYAFGPLGLRKVCAEALETNAASLRLHEKCGFVREGIFREQYRSGDKTLNIIRFGLLASEWAGSSNNHH